MSYKPKVSDPATAEELLALAVEADQTSQACGPHDPAYSYFCRERDHFFKLALEAEQTT